MIDTQQGWLEEVSIFESQVDPYIVIKYSN